LRIHGTLAKWNDDRGFGFIAPAGGGDEVFVHVSAFPRDGVRPQVGELVSFEVEPGRDGKQRAVHLWRPGRSERTRAGERRTERATRHRHGHRHDAHPLRDALTAIAAVAILGVLGMQVYPAIRQRFAPEAAPPAQAPRLQRTQARLDPQSACDGRTSCPQMTSCAEATYFIQHCPNTQMDGDGDGVPCESQWCDVPGG